MRFLAHEEVGALAAVIDGRYRALSYSWPPTRACGPAN